MTDLTEKARFLGGPAHGKLIESVCASHYTFPVFRSLPVSFVDEKDPARPFEPVTVIDVVYERRKMRVELLGCPAILILWFPVDTTEAECVALTNDYILEHRMRL